MQQQDTEVTPNEERAFTLRATRNLTYKEIGIELGITTSGARFLCLSAQQKKEPRGHSNKVVLGSVERVTQFGVTVYVIRHALTNRRVGQVRVFEDGYLGCETCSGYFPGDCRHVEHVETWIIQEESRQLVQ